MRPLRTDDLISPQYLADQKWLHAQPKGYGGKGDKWAEQVRYYAGPLRVGSVLDYGCGQGSLGRALAGETFEFAEYDPAIKGKDALPEPADLVVCTDVLEHVEPDKIDAVLDHLHRLTRMALFVVIATGPAVKTLRDGRNAHILIRPDDWWRQRLGLRFRGMQPAECRSHKEFAALMVDPI